MILAMILAAAQPTPTIFTPSSKWIVNYKDLDCSLTRNFSNGAKTATFGIVPSVHGGYGYLVLVTPDNGNDRPRGVKITFNPSSRSYDALMYGVEIKGQKRQMIKRSVNNDMKIQDVVESTSITAMTGESESIDIKFGSMTAALGALKLCERNLLERFGADPDAMVPPIPPEETLRIFRGHSYPREAINERAQGRTVATLSIGRDGRPTACKVAVSAGSKLLDKETCKIAMGGLRVGKAGSADPDTRWVIMPVRWVLPFASPPSPSNKKAPAPAPPSQREKQNAPRT